MSGHFTFEKSDAPGSATTTMYKAMDKTGDIVPYFLGMELLAAETEDGALFRSRLLRVTLFPTNYHLHPCGQLIVF